MKTAVVSMLVGIAVLGAAAGGYWYGALRTAPGSATPSAASGGAKAAPSPKAPATPTVEVVKVAAASLPQTITTVGSLRSDESVVLRPEIAGRVTEVLFKEGQRVKTGDTLLRLDAAINAADLQHARANLTLAQSKYERSLDLAKRNFISSQAKDEAKNALDVAQAALALAEAKLAQTVLKAPFAGIIGLRLVSVGDYVKEGQDLVNLEAIDPLKVDFRVPEVYLKQVSVGQPIEVALDALPGQTYVGKVIAVNPLLDAAGRALVIRAQVSNQDTTLRPGMFARVTLITRAEKETLVLPEEALVPQGTEQYVFRIADGKAARVKVETGLRRDGKVEILKGVAKDEVIVKAGQQRLRDGAAVRVAGAGKAAATRPEGEAPAPARKDKPEAGQ